MLAKEFNTDLLWLPPAAPGQTPDAEASSNDPVLLLNNFDNAVVRFLIWTSLVMLAFGAGVMLGRAL